MLDIEVSGGVGIITLNRPGRLNALSRDLQAAIAKAVRKLDESAEVRVLIVTGAGRAFCAGLDLKEIATQSEGVAVFGGFQGDDPIRSIETCSKPVIAAVNGVAITGGFELALSCDLVVASTAATFADTHARMGIMPGWGLSQKLSRLVGIYRAKQISLTGNYVDARRANEWGLVNEVVAPGELMARCREIAADIASTEPDSIRTYKNVIDQGFAMSMGEGSALERMISTALTRSLQRETLSRNIVSVQGRGRDQTAGSLAD